MAKYQRKWGSLQGRADSWARGFVELLVKLVAEDLKKVMHCVVRFLSWMSVRVTGRLVVALRV